MKKKRLTLNAAGQEGYLQMEGERQRHMRKKAKLIRERTINLGDLIGNLISQSRSDFSAFRRSSCSFKTQGGNEKEMLGDGSSPAQRKLNSGLLARSSLSTQRSRAHGFICGGKDGTRKALLLPPLDERCQPLTRGERPNAP